MKSSLQQKEDSLSNTSECEKIKIKENDHLFNHIDKLAADHYVTVSKTMIKITYKKPLKDENASDHPDADHPVKKSKPTATNLSSSNISFIAKSPKGNAEKSKGVVFHSTPKQPPQNTEKKKKYVNGLNLTSKPNNSEGKGFGVKAHENGSSSPKKNKTTNSPNKQASKHESDKRFLKGNGIVKVKSSISEKSRGEGKKTKKPNKESDKKSKKLANGAKEKTGGEKREKKIGGLKRKASSMELDAFAKSKKLKTGVNKGEEVNGGGGSEERSRGEVKRPIMLVDPDLPAGWTRFIRTKNKGSANEQYVVYVVNPQGKKFRFKWKLRRYLQRTNSTLDADQFFFGLYQRPKPSASSSTFEKYENETSPEPENEDEKPDETSSNDGKELLLSDPDLPFGWKRIIHSNAANGRKQVHIISPDGKIFRRRYRLNEYLMKHQFGHNVDRFYFGLYPKKEANSSNNLVKEKEEKTLNSNTSGSAMIYKNKKTATNFDNEINVKEFKVNSKLESLQYAMHDDPNLPEGWKRFIKIRSCGESAGRMEVVIVSPDGRRHRSKKHLQHYLLQKQLNYKVGDFDFTVFGKSNVKKRSAPPLLPPEPKPEPEPNPEPCDFSFFSMKKKFTDKPVPELDISSLKDTVITPEGHMINTVNGLMICSDLSSARNERRQRLPRHEHEKQLKNYLNSEGEVSFDGCEIPTFWVERLIKCRPDFRSLESDAVSTIAEFTKKFVKTLAVKALTNSKQPEAGLMYEDVAELVDRTRYLSFLKTLIPQKITFKEYIKLNRPKQFLSFT